MPEKPHLNLSSIEVVAAQPQAADSRKISSASGLKNESSQEAVYLVKLYLNIEVIMARPAMGLRLYIGDDEIKKYSSFKNGIYFKVYDPAFFEDHAGEPVRFTTDGQDFIDTGAIFPEFSGRVQPEVETNIATHLPSQSQALSE